MLLTITNTSAPATDLGYLLVKHPEHLQSFEASFGAIHAFYPEATTEHCTAALLLDVDPVALVRGRPGTRGDGALLDQYVNDWPYVDHRFEWTRAEFQRWSNDVAARFGYQARFLPIGPDDPVVGPPTQMGVFTRD